MPEAPKIEEEETRLLVVGIGASAGGLEAIGELLRHVATDRMTFIVVQHLSPQHTSILAELLAKESKLQVVTATDGVTLEGGRVYVTPPNAQLAVSQGVLGVITMSSARGPRLPIDSLFRSLAEDQGERAIGIVLSGTGTDGTFGLKAIKAASGLTFVQDPTTAKYDGMPRSALASGDADFCLSPAKIARELARIAKSRRVRAVPAPARPHEPRSLDAFGKLVALIRSKFNLDLMDYKRATIDRRIERRMMLREIAQLSDYVKFVESNRDELPALYKDLLISVTSFFRDPEAFQVLKTQAFPKLLETREPTAGIRIWVPACASGEEAYSIAICLLEYVESNNLDTKVEIFATDIDEAAIQHARRGLYAANITQDVSRDRLARFFTQRENAYLISRRVRDLVVFSTQNILRDAPFSRIDLVSCRNLLIYLQPSGQQKVLRIFHYALRPVGYLLLGTSETAVDSNPLFSLVDRGAKLYSRRVVVSEAPLDLAYSAADRHEAPAPSAAAPSRPSLDLQGLADRKVLELYGPAGVVVNEELDILQFRGHTSPYLEPAPGAPNFSLLRFVRLELHMQLQSVVRQALDEQRRVVSDATYTHEGKRNVLKLDVVPLQDPDTKARCLLVLFSSSPAPKEIPVVAQGQGAEMEQPRLQLAERNEELERELALTKEYLQTINEEKDSTLEELKSANEELQASNEELQSLNEELETSKEELQSTNEELSTVNDELKSRMIELAHTNDDLHNVLAGVDNAVVMVGLDLRIRRYTAAAEKLFNLVPGDIGRSISFIDAFLAIGPLEPKVAAVIQRLSPIEEEVLAGNKRWYEVKIIPYKTLDLAIRGALITLIDIDVRKRAEAITRDVGAYAARFLAAIGHPLLIVDAKLRVVWSNDIFLSTFQLTPEETVGSLLGNLGAREIAGPGLRGRLEQVFASATTFREYELTVEIPERGRRTVKVGGSLIPVTVETPLALVSIEANASAQADGQ